MKFLYTSLLIILLFNSIGLPQTLWGQIINDDKLDPLEKAWFGGLFLFSTRLDSNGIDPLDSNVTIKVAPIRNDTANTLRDELEPDVFPMELYKGFFDNLEANGYILDNYDDIHNQGENLFCFTYDWRKNNNHNAQLLSYFIDSVRTWTGADKVNLVGHSMGGTLSKTFINNFDESRIDKMVFIGTSHLGAPEMITVLLTGRLFDWLKFFVADWFVRSLGRNLPSCYQLIPSSSYFNLEFNNGISTDVEIYSECFQLPNGSYTNYSEMIEYLRNIVILLWEDLNVALIDSSEIFKETIDTVDFGAVEVFNIVGHNLETIGKNSVLIGPLGIFVLEERNLNGDHTVPVRSAELINNRVFENTYYIPDIIHSALPSSLPTLEILLGVFGDPQITYFPDYADPPYSYAAITNVENDLELPNSFYLSQNYPNPFNPVTTIRYQLPVTSNVTLRLYDVLGNEIATLVNEEKSAGEYDLTFYAGILPSGIYFYRLQVNPANGGAGSFVETKKMVLLR